MRKAAMWFTCLSLLVTCAVTAADPPYVGRWKVNQDKSDYGPAFAFSRSATGELRFTQGDVNYVVRLDGNEYPHPLGGVVSWRQLDPRRWETRMTKDGKLIGGAIYTLSEDGDTLTSAPPAGLQGSPSVFRRTSGERTGLDGAWSHKTVNAAILQIDVAEGYDLVIRQGGALCKANFDGKDYPTSDANVTCTIARTSDRGFSF